MSITDTVKHLIVINVIVFACVYLPGEFGNYGLTEWLRTTLSLYFPTSPLFQPIQLISYMFMHGGVSHLLFNMLGLFFLGPLVEYTLGAKKFLLLYFAAGFAAMFLHQAIDFISFIEITKNLSPEQIFYANEQGPDLVNSIARASQAGAPIPAQAQYVLLQYIPMLGASGAVYGISVAFAVLFPDLKLQLMFIPIPIKAKYLILAFVIIDMVKGLGSYNDNVAHFAHIGGAIAGFLLTYYWKKQGIK